MSVWKTAGEWADFKLSNIPHTKRGVAKFAIREGWQELGVEFARKRKGRGGGWEYHLNCLPAEAKAEYERRQRVTEVAVKEAETKALVAQTPESIDARRREIMECRAAVVLELERRAVICGSMSKAIGEFMAEAKAELLPEPLATTVKKSIEKGKALTPSRPTLYNWRKAWLDGGAQALIPEKRAQETKQGVPAWMAGFLRHYGKPSKPTISHALEQFEEQLGDASLAPSYDQVRRALKMLQGTENFLDAHKGREGPLALKARLMFTRRTLEGMDPTTVYTADGKTFDAEIAHPVHGQPFRPEITTIIDVVTRKIVGWSIDLAENARAVSDALRMACEQHGIPAIFYTDRGPGYRNEHMDHATLGLCARLGITPTHSLPYNSQARGMIERLNGTVWNKAAKDFATYVGPDMDREAKQKAFKQTRKDLREFGTSRLLPSFEEFMSKVEQIVSAYNDRVHSSLKVRCPESGRRRNGSPNECWAEFARSGFEHFALTTAEANELFRPHVKRRCRRGEVEWIGNQYAAPELNAWHGHDVLVGYDVHDGSKVWVRELELRDGEQHPGRLICVAEFWHNKERYMPVSFQRHAEEKRAEGQLRRLDTKRDRVQADLDAPVMLEHTPETPVDFIEAEVVREVTPAAENVVQLAAKPAVTPGRPNPYNDPDIDLAWKIVDAPEGTEIPEGHIRLMSDLLSNLAAVEMMREVGLPQYILQDRIEAARQPLQSSRGA